jgi:hypothetical protein
LLVHFFLVPSNVFNEVDGHHIFVGELIRVAVEIVGKGFIFLMLFFEFQYFPQSLGASPLAPQYQGFLVDEFSLRGF